MLKYTWIVKNQSFVLKIFHYNIQNWSFKAHITSGHGWHTKQNWSQTKLKHGQSLDAQSVIQWKLNKIHRCRSRYTSSSWLLRCCERRSSRSNGAISMNSGDFTEGKSSIVEYDGLTEVCLVDILFRRSKFHYCWWNRRSTLLVRLDKLYEVSWLN